jgi:hypothetical protein
MRRLVTGVAAGMLVLLASPAFAGEVAVSELVADGASYAGTEITVVGELIGDYGSRRDGFTWTQLNGDAYAYAPVVGGGALKGANVGIGIRMPTELAQGLDSPGRYRTVGPLVRVTGIWRYHDPVRQGETYLDVSTLDVVEPGRTLRESPVWVSYFLGFAFLGIAGVAWRRYTHKRDAVS